MKTIILVLAFSCLFGPFLFGQNDSTSNASIGAYTSADTLYVPDFEELVLASSEPEPINMDDVREYIGYPDIAREANIQGQVVIRLLVDTMGNSIDYKVIKKGHPILAEAVEVHVMKLKFSPAILEGEKILFWVNIPFMFKIIGGGKTEEEKRARRQEKYWEREEKRQRKAERKKRN